LQCLYVKSNLEHPIRSLYHHLWKTASRLREASITDMSPLVQRPRTGTKRPTPPTPGSDEHWTMLLFESLSAGVMAILVGVLAVIAVVGLYVTVVWPLTFWDLANLGLEEYGSWVSLIFWSVFASGSLAGYLCFSGAAFPAKPAAKRSGTPLRSGKSSRV